MSRCFLFTAVAGVVKTFGDLCRRVPKLLTSSATSNRRNLVALLSLLTSCAPVFAAESGKPNILFVLVDDMGWRDLACYGHKIHETPNIDRLAARGMRFTNAYAACPICAPSRAAIMTGKFPSNTWLRR